MINLWSLMFGCGKGGDTIAGNCQSHKHFYGPLSSFSPGPRVLSKEMTGYLCYFTCFDSHILVIFYIDFIYINIFYL
jgi:hypothetical protein